MTDSVGLVAAIKLSLEQQQEHAEPCGTCGDEGTIVVTDGSERWSAPCPYCAEDEKDITCDDLCGGCK